MGSLYGEIAARHDQREKTLIGDDDQSIGVSEKESGLKRNQRI